MFLLTCSLSYSFCFADKDIVSSICIGSYFTVDKTFILRKYEITLFPFDIIISTKLSRKNLASFLFSFSFLYDLPGVAVKPIILVLKFEK